ncbi:MAG: HAMP domain-containing sensor histidine kinase [Bacteroides sp.]|nr:HAMP domain-containing sensor histidine kinase [Bacteroides sp.]
MKKFYYITCIATLAIIGLQLFYIHSLYVNYCSVLHQKAEEALVLSLDKEFSLRKGKRPSDKSGEAVLQIESFHLDLDGARDRMPGASTGDVLQQIRQDFAMERGLTLELSLLDSIYSSAIKGLFDYSLILYDRNKQPVEVAGAADTLSADFSSVLHPIGTHGYQYIQVKTSVLLSPFIREEAWALFLSVAFMAIACITLLFQFIVIRRKTRLLNKQEESVNGTIHDLKAPLNSAITVMSYLAMTVKEQSVQEIVRLSSQNLKHLVSNIDSLLIMARRNRKKLVLNRTEVNIRTLVEQVKTELDILYQEKPHQIIIVPPADTPILAYVDYMYMENVLRNLMENAIKYADDNVKVTVDATVDNHSLHLSVSDNGWGISPSDLKKIFEPFFQVPQEHNLPKKGYGIGLTQAKYIVEEHGGRIGVQSERRKGSCFTIIIPC